ncbi:MAG: ISL3 family transposase [Parachlamydiaceae bacterium]|nr:ISL3 family transposase [Parachlamydiaceae bacterium]
MSASLLYHTNQITDVQVKNVEYFHEIIVFHVLYEPSKAPCPCCGWNESTSKGVKRRKLRMAPLGNKAAFLLVEIHRLKCVNCSFIWWPTLPFARIKKRHTVSFELYVIELMRFATIEHVAKFLGVSWSLVKKIHKVYLQREYKDPDLKSIQYLGVDEFSISKGHEYMTIFINLETGEIIHAVEGKSIESVTPFILQLKEKAIQLKAIAMDMNAAYASATKKHLTNVDVVFDRFHIVALLNTAIDEIRRDQQAKCNAVGLKAIKGMRFLLLSNYEKLNPKKQSSLACLLEVNKPIALAHAMKEQIRLFWTKPSVKEGAQFLCWWIMDAVESGIRELEKTGRTLLRHGNDILNYFKHRITNGKTEGINNKIKTMKRQAYGFRDIDYFKLRLYSLHKTGYSFAR